MASVIQTTAVALRKGNTEANKAFTGILAELVADLGTDGNGLGPNSTLRLHNGVIQGGIPMCRADLLNISTSQLAVGRDQLGMTNEKNLAYADLSNFEATSDESVKTNIKTTLSSYGLATDADTDEKLALKANKSFSNIDTADLATGEGELGKHAGKNLAYADGTNIDTSGLVDPVAHDGTAGNKPLAYADTSNINTADLATNENYHSGGDGNKLLAYKDLSNIEGQDINYLLFVQYPNILNIEQTTNKTNSFFDDQGHLDEHIPSNVYPTANATIQYTKWEVEQGNFLKRDFENATSFYALYSNFGVKPDHVDENWYPNGYFTNYLYSGEADGVQISDTGFITDRLYPTYIDISVPLIDNPPASAIQKEFLQLYIASVGLDGWPESGAVGFYQSCGTVDLSSYSPVTANDINGNKIIVTFTSVEDSLHSGYYNYTVTGFTYDTTQSTGNPAFVAGITDINEQISIPQQLWILAVETENGQLVHYDVVPTMGVKQVGEEESGEISNLIKVYSGSNEAVVIVNAKSVIGEYGHGAGLAKTDLSNLLGMTSTESQANSNLPWRLIYNEDIPAYTATATERDYYSLTTEGKVWEAIKAAINTQSIPKWQPNTAYVAGSTPSIVYYNGNIYYCKTAHTSGNSWSVTNWNYIGNTTYEFINRKADGLASGTGVSLVYDPASTTQYPSSKVVADYITTRLDQYALADTYRGQVLYYLNDETNIPTVGPNNTPLVSGDRILINHLSTAQLGGRPQIGTYDGSNWSFTPFVNDTSMQSNGDYVYCLDLGNWDTTLYYHAPGNLTWNANTNKLDVAPDAYNQPDEVTLTKNATTGEVGIKSDVMTKINNGNDAHTRVAALETRINGAYVPAPEYFSPNGSTGTFTLQNQPSSGTNAGKVAFDVYVNGVFQYPNTYTYNSATRQLTFSNSFLPAAGTNTMAIIYRGIIWGSDTDVPASCTNGRV